MLTRPHSRALAHVVKLAALRRITLALGVVALVVPSAPVLADDVSSGETLFRAYCAACHVGGEPRNSESALAGAGNASAIVSAIKRIDAMKALDRILGAGDLDQIARYLADRAGTKTPFTVNVVEYYHAWFDHYFITAIPVEIAKLDDGAIDGWVRTGRQFKVRTAPGTGLSPVCRFFSKSFDAKSSHFYTPSTSECMVVKANTKWRFEDTVFYVAVPDVKGACPRGTNAVYRLYNQGHGGAPNHRLTTDIGVREQMIGRGWVAEGYGALGVSMCIPP